jgi:membrane protein required for colicin V production
MWLDIFALAIFLLFAFLGARRGGLASGLALAAIGVAYAAAILAAPRFGPLAAELTGVSEWLGMPIAGSVAFVAAFLGMGLVAKLLSGVSAPVEGEPRSPKDRFLGGVFGALRGGLIVLLLSYLALWVDALRATGTAPNLPELGSSAAASAAGSIVEAGVNALAADAAGGRVIARIAARPGDSIAELQALMEHPVIHELQGDTIFWSHVEHGNIDAALHRRGAVALVHDADMRRQLGELGLIDEASVADSQVFRAAAADVLRQLGPRIRNLKEDPELQALMHDPEVAAALQSGNHLALLGHPGFRSVVARVMASE